MHVQTWVACLSLSRASGTPQESQSTMVTPVRSVGGLDGSSCLVSSSLSSVLREESPLCHAYVCVVSPHLCVCMGMCMVWQRCAVGSALSVLMSPILGQSTSACWLCLLAVPDVVCACLLAHHACLWLPRVGCLWSVLCVLCMSGVRTSHTHTLTPPSPHNPHYITSVLVGFPPTVAHTTRVLPRRVDLWNMVHVSLSFTRWVCGSVVHPIPHISPPCVLSSLVGRLKASLHRAPIHLSPPVVMHVYVLS